MARSAAQQYDADKRDEAKKQGQALRALSLPGLVVDQDSPGYLARYDRDQRLIELVSVTDHALRHLVSFDALLKVLMRGDDPATVEPFLDADGQEPDDDEDDDDAPLVRTWVVFATEAEFNLVMAIADRSYPPLARVMRVARSLPFQGRLGVLTRALSTKFYAPAGTKEHSIEGWAALFGLTGQPLVAVATALIVKATEAQGAMVGTTAGMMISEFHALNSALFGDSGVEAVMAYRSAARAENTWRTLLAADPDRRPRNLVDGTTALVTNFRQVSDHDFTAEVSQPFTFKVGRRVTVFALTGEPGRTAPASVELELKRITSGGGARPGELTAWFHLATSKGKAFDAVRALTSTRSKLAVREAGFSAVPRATAAEVWLHRTNLPQPASLDLPLEVVIAGAPRA